MPAPSIAPLPPPPSRGDAPDVFSARADAFVGHFPTLRTDINAVSEYIENKAAEVEGLVSSGGLTGTSTTSLSTSVGSKTLTVQTNRSFVTGAFVSIADSAEPTTRVMYGPVTAYSKTTGALTVDVQSVTGSGTNADWTVSLSGPIGPLPAKATGNDLRAATNDAKFLTPKSVADAAALVALTDAATIAFDLAAGTNFSVTLAGNRTLGAPSNAKPGMSGTILIKQDATGSRTLAYNTAWKPFGSTPALSTAAGAVDLLTWIVEDTGKVRFTLAKGGAA